MACQKKCAVAVLLLSMLSLQCGSAIAKYLFPQLGPAGTVTLRVGLAGLLLAMLFRPDIRRFKRKEWLCVLFYGLSIGVMNTTFYYGIQRVPLGIGIAVEFSGPLGLALLSSRKPLDFLWALLAIAGILLIVPWHGGVGAVDSFGMACVLIAGIFWALYIVMANRIAGVLKSTEAVSCGLCVATLFVLPFGIASGKLMSLNWSLLGMGAGVAICATALPFTLDLFVIRKLPPKTYSVLQSLQPAIGAIVAWLSLGERLALPQWLAIAFIMAASGGAAICAPEAK